MRPTVTTFPSLDALFAAMCAGGGAGDDGLDWTALPVFGGAEPAGTTGVWSWDEARLIVGSSAADLRIVSRDDYEWEQMARSGDVACVSALPDDVERHIAIRLVRDLLAAGLSIEVWNGGGEPELAFSRDCHEILRALGASDQDDLVVRGADETAARHKARWITLIYGNGADLISDYSMSMGEDLLAGATALAERLSDKAA